MRPQHGGAGTIQILIDRAVKRQQVFLPPLPLRNVVAKYRAVVVEQRRPDLFRCFSPDTAESERQHELAAASAQIDFSSQSNVPVVCALIGIFQLKILRELLPSIRKSSEAHRHPFPWRRASKSQRIASRPLGE